MSESHKPLTVPGEVIIPRSPLGLDLKEADALKKDMKRLLSDLEKVATGHSTDRPGDWRRNPLAWRDRHLPKP